MTEMKITDLFRIEKRYLRSVHLERDFGDPSATDGYVLTDHARDNLDRIAVGLTDFSGQRAWRITGDYGAGKSSFALVLAKLLSGRHKELPSEIRKTLSVQESPVSAARFLPVLVTGSREPISIALLRALVQALNSACAGGKGAKIVGKLNSLLGDLSLGSTISDDAVIELIEEANLFLKASRKGNGLLIILDELGKFLEFAALHPDRQDVYFLQRLAEIAMRSGKSPLFVVGLLHQGFSVYADQLSQSAQKEWEKVAGRFEELVLDQPLEQVTVLVANALNLRMQELPIAARLQAELDMETVLNMGWFGGAFNRKQILEVSPRIYPLHPSVIPVLVRLFSRFGQNERSLFSFLLSNEPFALHDFSGRGVGKDSFYRLHNLYDYIRAAFGHRLSVQSYRSRWNHIDSIIESFHSADEIELHILKVVGLLNLLDANNLLASEEAILFAVSREGVASSDYVVSVLKRLQKEKKVLYHRGIAGGYCLWPHTSVNLERIYEDASKALPQVTRISSAIDKYLVTRPIVARRHYIETGNLRHFEVKYGQLNEFGAVLRDDRSGSDGVILIPLCENEGERKEALIFAKSPLLKGIPTVLFAVPKPLGNLGGLLTEVQRWQWIRDNTPELNSDTYAAEEVSRHIAEARKILERRIQNYIGLRQFTDKMELQWFYKGNHRSISNSREFLSFLSDICDEVYYAAPNVRNELVNRHSISSAAAGARMRLIERIFQHESRPFLGMDPEKKPPEMSIYLSLLKHAGLHRNVDGRFRIAEPPEESDVCKVRSVLNKIGLILEMNQERRVRIYDIYNKLRREPFGVRDGIIPILISVFAKANEQDVAFYENGTFMRRIEGADFQRIIKDPQSFEIQYCKITGIRSELFDRLMDVLGLKRETSRKTAILDIVQPLCQFAAKLPTYVHSTKKLSATAAAVRSALLSAREPASLLFNELPKACGVGAVSVDTDDTAEDIQRFVARLKVAIDELRGTYPALQQRMKSYILAACDVPGPFQDVRQALSGISDRILIAVTEPKLKAFCIRIADNDLPESEWLESLGSFVCSKPPSRWLDADEDVFYSEFGSLVSKFHRVESICFATGALNIQGDALRIAITQSDGTEVERIVHISLDEERMAAEMEAEITEMLGKNRRIGITAVTRAVWKAMSE